MSDLILRELNPHTLVPSLNPTLVVDGAGLEKVKNYFSRVTEFVPDYETNVCGRFYERRARTLQVGDRNEQYVIDLLAFAETKERLIASQGLYRSPQSLSEANLAVLQPVVDVIGPAFNSNHWLKIGQNLEFEYVVSKWCLGMRLWNLYCTQIAERLILNGSVGAFESGYYSLEDLVRKYCKLQISKALQTSFDLETPLTEDQIIYAALDCRLPFPIRNGQMKEIKTCGLERVTRIEMDAIPAFGDMHLNGMYVDPEAWRGLMESNQRELNEVVARLDQHFIPIVGRKQKWDDEKIAHLRSEWEATAKKSEEEELLSSEIRKSKKDPERLEELKRQRLALEEQRAARRAQARAAYDVEKSKATKKYKDDYEKMQGEAAINYGSPTQVLAALHAGPWGLNANNLKSSGDKILDKHAGIAVIDDLRDFRSLDKLIGTYGERWITPRDVKAGDDFGFVDPNTGRIHSRFNQLGADTGRPSSTNPNLLNLPRDDRYRACFTSRPGHDMVDKDCAGQELRILTQYSQEPSWKKAFRNKQDLHSISAEMLDYKSWADAALHEAITIMKDGKEKTIPPCAYYYNDKKKCSCPKHKPLRDKMKNINFGVAYDKQKWSTALELKITVDEAEKLLSNWKATFPITAKTLQNLRDTAYDRGEARDLAGRRRLTNKVSWDQAKKSAIKKYGEQKGCDQKRVMQMYHSLMAGVKRELGNFPIQASGATLMKRAMGCGYDADGKPYLWHILEPQHQALLLNYIYDEFVVESPEQHSKDVEVEIEDAIIRAGAEIVTVVPMESEGGIAKRWQK